MDLMPNAAALKKKPAPFKSKHTLWTSTSLCSHLVSLLPISHHLPLSLHVFLSIIPAPASLSLQFILMLRGYILCLKIHISAPWLLFGEVPMSPQRPWNVPLWQTHTKFHTSGLYLCAMIHTVADYFLEMFCLFPKRPWEAFYFLLDCTQKVFSSCKQLYVTYKLLFVTTLCWS